MSTSPHKTWEKIAAFADGELSGEECCELLKEAMAQPDQARCVEFQQQLRKLMAGCMDCEKTMRCPDELKDCVEGLADEHCRDDAPEAAPAVAVASTAAPPAQAPTVIGRIGQWLPLAVAAALFVAAVGVYMSTLRDEGAGQASFVNTGDGILSANLVGHFGQRHVRCASGVATPLQSDQFPAEVEALDEALTERFGPDLAGVPLDLSSIGYRYRVAGLCSVPGQGAVHVIYTGDAADAHGRQRSLSLWIKPFDAATDPAVEPGELHTAADRTAAHPIVLWRDADMIFYLVGDAMPEVEKAQELLALRS